MKSQKSGRSHRKSERKSRRKDRDSNEYGEESPAFKLNLENMGGQNGSPTAAMNPKFLQEHKKLGENVSEFKKELIKLQKAFNLCQE